MAPATSVTRAIAEFAVGPTATDAPVSLMASSRGLLERCASAGAAGGSFPWPAELRPAGRSSTLGEAFAVCWSLASEADRGPVEQAVPIGAAVWAVTRGQGARADAGAAVTVGREIAHRFLVVLGPSLSDRGWDPARLTAGIGAAVAVSRVLGLDVERAVAATALAATQAAGLAVPRGSLLDRAQWAKVALDAVVCGELAAGDFTAPSEPIEGRRGLVALLTPAVDPSAVVTDLGAQWWAAER